jgi:hypothetical protein
MFGAEERRKRVIAMVLTLCASSCDRHSPGASEQNAGANDASATSIYSGVLSGATKVETEPDGTQILYKPDVPVSRLRRDKWVDVEFTVIRKPVSSASNFRLTWMAYNGSCTKNRLAAVHGAGVGSGGDLVSMSADEAPFTPERSSVEGKVLQLVCQSEGRARRN